MADPVRGGTPYLNTALLATKVAAITNTARIFGIHIHNASAATVFLQMFDAASANVTVGTTVPTRVRGLATGASYYEDLSMPLQFDTAVTIAATTTATGSTAPSAGIVVELNYK